MTGDYKKVAWGVGLLVAIALLYAFYAHTPRGPKTSAGIDPEVLQRYSAPPGTTPTPIDPNVLKNYSAP